VTEADWVVCTDPLQMLTFLRGQSSDRKLRLFAVACCRMNWQFLDNAWRQTVISVERFADGLVIEDDAEWAWHGAVNITRSFSVEPSAAAAQQAASFAYHATAPRVLGLRAGVWEKVTEALESVNRANTPGIPTSNRRVLAALLREQFGNPFQPVVFDARWRTADVMGLARGIYEDRKFDRLPILGDALMDAGCDNDEIIAHCRGGDRHVRGCWVVDFVLGKE